MNRTLRGISWAGGRRACQVHDPDGISLFEAVSWGKKCADEKLVNSKLFYNNKYNGSNYSQLNVRSNALGFYYDGSLTTSFDEEVLCGTNVCLPCYIEFTYRNITGVDWPIYYIFVVGNNLTFGISNGGKLGTEYCVGQPYVNPGSVGTMSNWVQIGELLYANNTYEVKVWLTTNGIVGSVKNLTRGTTTAISQSITNTGHGFLTRISLRTGFTYYLNQNFQSIEKIRISGVVKGRWKVGF